MDKVYFKECINYVLQRDAKGDSIGTYGEKTLHKVLKLYFERDKAMHEVSADGYIADIFNENGIIEIQTRGFSGLEKKLSKYLVNYKVRLVFPICEDKYISWVNLETGEISKLRKSPKKGKVVHVLPEIYKIKKFIHNKNLTINVVVIDAVDYRYLNGWSSDKKRGSSRMERIPTDIKFEYEIKELKDYINLVPSNLVKGFCSNDFGKATGLSINKARSALTLLSKLNAVERIGKRGNKILYDRKQ